MQGVNFGRNTFLDKEELLNFQKLLREGSFLNVLGAASKKYGIVSDNVPSDKYFVTTQGTTAGTVDVTAGLMIDSNFNLINASPLKNHPIPANGNWYWIKYSYKQRSYEDCVVSINSEGRVSLSSGTIDFTEKIRGASTKIPTSVRFVPTVSSTPLKNTGIYEVTNVEDTHLDLSAYYDFTEESNLRMIVLGSIPLTEEFESEQMSGLYSYDSYEVSLMVEVALDTAPAKNDNEFYVCRVSNDGTGISIQDKRSDWWSFTQINDEVAGDVVGQFPNLFLKPAILLEKALGKTIEASRSTAKKVEVLNAIDLQDNLEKALTYLLTTAKNCAKQGIIEGYLTEAPAGIYEGFNGDGFPAGGVVPHWIVKLENNSQTYLYVTFEGNIYMKKSTGEMVVIRENVKSVISGTFNERGPSGEILRQPSGSWVAIRSGDTVQVTGNLYVEAILRGTRRVVWSVQYELIDLWNSFPPETVLVSEGGVTQETLIGCNFPFQTFPYDRSYNSHMEFPCSGTISPRKDPSDLFLMRIAAYWTKQDPTSSADVNNMSGDIEFSFNYKLKGQ